MRQLLWDGEPRNDAMAPIAPSGRPTLEAWPAPWGNDKLLEAGTPGTQLPGPHSPRLRCAGR
jgi:hypothetical protein